MSNIIPLYWQGLGDISCVDFDWNGKPIILPKPPTPFEELHCAEYDKYWVPLFVVKNDENTFEASYISALKPSIQ